MMPVLFNRKDHDDPESIWRWCRDNLKLSRSECERFVDSQRKSAERDLKKVQDQGSGPHWTGCFKIIRAANGAQAFCGVNYEDF